MTEDYVPSTAEIKGQACRLGGWREDAFDRWLAEHDAQVLRDAAEAWHEPHDPETYAAADWLGARADRIAGGGAS